MKIKMLHGKIHRVTVTETQLNYTGSITIDKKLLESAGILEYQQVQVVNINNGVRFETYTIPGGDGVICLNGASARCAEPGDKLIIMAYAVMTPEEAKLFTPTVVFADENNAIVSVMNYEKHS